MPWLGFPPAIDLANTVVVTTTADVDLLESGEGLAAWAAAERGRIPGTEATAGRLTEVRALRADVRAALFAAAEGRPLPPGPVAALNRTSAEAPSYPVLRAEGVEEVFVDDDPFLWFRATVARSAITVLAGDDRDRLAVCRAPSCGMLFLRRGKAQKWCCDSCGNRSRVARHAQRQRAGVERSVTLGPSGSGTSR